MQTIEALLEKRGGAKKDASEMKRVAEAVIHEVVSAIFADLPEVNVMSVEGYAPHFNDGDPCRWGIGAQVEWKGHATYAPIGDIYDDGDEDERDSHIAALMDNWPNQWGVERAHPLYEKLDKAVELLETLLNEFEILDGDNNGTWWLYIRDANEAKGYRIESDTFEHD